MLFKDLPFMKKIFFISLLLIPFFEFSSCCKGGSGGDATLDCSVFHHSKPIPGATVYVKYNATEFPGTDVSVYSANAKASGTSNTLKIEGLHCGDYFLYGVGFDSALGLPVTGGVHVQIKYSDRKKEQSENVPVTE
jgi:hypothetical protein